MCFSTDSRHSNGYCIIVKDCGMRCQIGICKRKLSIPCSAKKQFQSSDKIPILFLCFSWLALIVTTGFWPRSCLFSDLGYPTYVTLCYNRSFLIRNQLSVLKRWMQSERLLYMREQIHRTRYPEKVLKIRHVKKEKFRIWVLGKLLLYNHAVVLNCQSEYTTE